MSMDGLQTYEPLFQKRGRKGFIVDDLYLRIDGVRLWVDDRSPVSRRKTLSSSIWKEGVESLRKGVFPAGYPN